MKKKIGYILLIIISIVGSRMIFGKDYHLNSNNLIANNLYEYDIFDHKKAVLALVDDEELYYILSSGTTNKMQYSVIKYNLISNKIINQYNFNTNYVLNKIQMFSADGYLYLTAINSNTFYKFNKHLELIDQKIINTKFSSFGVYNNDFITTSNNQIFYQNILIDTVPKSCGQNIEMMYNKELYLHFHNPDTGFGCLYNVNNKQREYLDYHDVSLINHYLLEYQNNRLSFKYNGNTYYFNDINESNNLKMHVNGDYLFTIDFSKNSLKIYNLETQKIIYERYLFEISNGKIGDILIDDYVYFTVIKDNVTKLYIWDYLKETRINKDMISYNEKEYKFKNNELREEIKNNYNIDVYLYDQAVMYFDEYYVIPSYDDILINSRLMNLKEILKEFNTNELVMFNNLVICLEKNIVSNKLLENSDTIAIDRNNKHIIAINITNDNFKNILRDKLNQLRVN